MVTLGFRERAGDGLGMPGQTAAPGNMTNSKPNLKIETMAPPV